VKKRRRFSSLLSLFLSRSIVKLLDHAQKISVFDEAHTKKNKTETIELGFLVCPHYSSTLFGFLSLSFFLFLPLSCTLSSSRSLSSLLFRTKSQRKQQEEE
jgi:hypothetical protein